MALGERVHRQGGAGSWFIIWFHVNHHWCGPLDRARELFLRWVHVPITPEGRGQGVTLR